MEESVTVFQRVLVIKAVALIVLILPSNGQNVPEVKVIEGVDQQIVQQEEMYICIGCNPLIFGQQLNVNNASLEQLKQLPGIGEKTALAIINHRPLTNIEDLDDVKGIGPITLSKIESQIRFRP